MLRFLLRSAPVLIIVTLFGWAAGRGIYAIIPKKHIYLVSLVAGYASDPTAPPGTGMRPVIMPDELQAILDPYLAEAPKDPATILSVSYVPSTHVYNLRLVAPDEAGANAYLDDLLSRLDQISAKRFQGILDVFKGKLKVLDEQLVQYKAAGASPEIEKEVQRATTERAAVQAILAAQVETKMTFLDMRAVSSDPDYPDAHAFTEIGLVAGFFLAMWGSYLRESRSRAQAPRRSPEFSPT